MKIRLKEKGFENYTGQMGAILFKNGVSVRDVLEIDKRRLAGVMYVVDENGVQVSTKQDASGAVAVVGRETKEQAPVVERVGGDDSEMPVFTHPEKKKTKEEPKKVVPETRYTIADLEAIADEKGINGLREIANPLGIKATSIRKLIEEIHAVAGKNE